MLWFAFFKINKAQRHLDKPVKSPKVRHACEGRHPEPFENTGFPPWRE
jgi:hypothetical protein